MIVQSTSSVAESILLICFVSGHRLHLNYSLLFSQIAKSTIQMRSAVQFPKAVVATDSMDKENDFLDTCHPFDRFETVTAITQ